MPEAPLNILLIDDELADQRELKRMLEAFGHQVLSADGAAQAMQTFSRQVVHLVLLNSRFLFQADDDLVTILQNAAKDMALPIVFLADADLTSLGPCLKRGGADIFVKPYNVDYIYHKLKSLAALINRRKSFASQRQVVKNCSERLSQQYSIRRLFEKNIAPLNCLDDPAIHSFYHVKQAFNRSIMLAAHKPDGGMHLLLGEFNAHCLEAALGAFPVADIFFSLTEKGFIMRQILVELNRRLASILPENIVFEGAFVDVKMNEGSVEVWNAGAPDVFIYLQNAQQPLRCEAKNLALGKAASLDHDYSVDLVPYQAGDELLIFSHGLLRLKDKAQKDLQQVLTQGRFDVSVMADKVAWLSQALHEQELLDHPEDISCLGVSLAAGLAYPQQYDKKACPANDSPADFTFDYVLNAASLKNTDPLPYLLQILTTVPGLHNSSAQVFMILSELYSNALEHGVLKLNSAAKNSPEGFAHYYECRQSALQALEDGFVKIHIKVKADSHKSLLVLRVEDSGDGFDFSRLNYAVDNTNMLYNRGFALLNQLCEKIEFSHGGRVATAYYDWQRGAFG